MWNFVQSNIFGVEVSGMEVHSSLLVTKMSEAAEWLHGGAFGSEGGLDTTIVLVIAILLIWILPAKKEKTNIYSTMPTGSVENISVYRKQIVQNQNFCRTIRAYRTVFFQY